jgi:hypothetical protein
MRKGRKDPWDKPWVAYAAIGGVVVVVVLALVYFLGGGGAATLVPGPVQGTSAQGTTAAHPAVTTSASTAKSPSGSSGSTTVKPTATPLLVSDRGVSVKVSYLGGFSGNYGVAGSLVKVQDSGDRAYVVDNPTGTVTATIHKDDSSAKHELTVEIWKDGKVVKSGKTSLPNGEVSISYQM